MASTYLKGVRTRYRNTLSSAMEQADHILNDDFSGEDLEEEISGVERCLEKIKVYCEKLELQSEKVVSALDESEGEQSDEFLTEDTTLCSEAMEKSFDLRQLKTKLVNLHAARMKEESEEPVTTKLVKLQTDMQKLLSSQMKREEMKNKLDAERASTVKLPKIEMPFFNGDKTKWIEFWDSFDCAIHRNKSIANIEKFNYLRGKLVGEAKIAVSGLVLSNENYQIAIDILKERFGNNQEIIDVHYNQLINIPPVSSKISSLRPFLDNVQRHLRSLQVLHQNVNQDVFISMIRAKLPEDVLLQLEMMNNQKHSGPEHKWTVDTLIGRLHEYVVARERASKDSKKNPEMNKDSQASNRTFTSKSFSKHTGNMFQRPDGRISTQTLSSNSVKPDFQKGIRSKRCRYCQLQHWSDECKKYPTLKERKECLKGCCYKCLKDGHIFKDCKSNKKCVYCGEMNVHHRSLCPKKFQPIHSLTHSTNEVIYSTTEVDSTEESGLMSTNETVLMQTALVDVANPKTAEETTVRLFLDSGSHRSYVTQALAEKLDLKEEGEQDIHLITFGSTTPKRVSTKYTTLNVKLKNGKHLQIMANIVPVISGALHRKPLITLQSERVQDILGSVQLADDIPTKSESAPIELLIGNDYYLDIVHGEKIKVQDGLYLLSSKLGWILSGRLHDIDNEQETNMLILSYDSNVGSTQVFTSIDSSLPTSSKDLDDFWNIESIGIVDKYDKSNDDIAMDKFKSTLQFDEGRYHVKWPWKEESMDIPTNKELAMGRLKSSRKHMKNKPEVMSKYNKVISEQLEKGIIEKVDPNHLDGPLHYLPHHAIIKPDKTTTKLRIVYDASAKTRKENLSLNECLHRGPVMLHDLCGLLMRFRLHPIALVADIEKAFLQIGLQRDQRDVTRFLWFKDITNPSTHNDNIQEYRFCRVPFGVISSPFLLGATVEHHLDTYDCDVAKKVKSDIYVDNVITGTDTVAEAKDIYHSSKKIFNAGAMNLREWISNNKDVTESI